MTENEKQMKLENIKSDIVYELFKKPLDFVKIQTLVSKAIEVIDSYEISKLNDKMKELERRVENMEGQMKEDKEEQIKKLNAELDYAKFCSELPHLKGGK